MGDQGPRCGHCHQGEAIFAANWVRSDLLQIAALLIIVVAGLIFLAVSPSSHSAIAPDQLMQVQPHNLSSVLT